MDFGGLFTVVPEGEIIEEPVLDTPMQEPVTDDTSVRMFRFDIEPLCVQSVKFSRFGAYQPKRVTQYKAAIRRMAQEQCKGAPWTGLIEVLPVTIAFKWPSNTRKKYKEAYARGEVIYHDRKRDVEDNLLKGVYDALSGVVYEDDCKIVKSNGRRKIYAPKGYIEIGFRLMPEGTLTLPK